MSSIKLPMRLKRLRRTSSVRAMVRETHIHKEQLIAPLFIHASLKARREIPSMPGQYQYSLNDLGNEIESLSKLGVPAVLLFGIPEVKDDHGSGSLQPTGIIQKSIAAIRDVNPEMTIIADVCFCEYTTHGHCGVITDENIDNDATLALLAQQAVSYADAGADWVAPSSMTDGMVKAIREALDESGHHHVAILSYAVKYSSSFYGPFREAAQGAPAFGDRKTYQMDPANRFEAIREAALDVSEGADLLMVKPAMNYLDIISLLKQHFSEIPLAAYQVSGEYAMLKAAAEKGFINEKEAILESLLSIKRAGADLLITYFAKQVAQYLSQAAEH